MFDFISKRTVKKQTQTIQNSDVLKTAHTGIDDTYLHLLNIILIFKVIK